MGPPDDRDRGGWGRFAAPSASCLCVSVRAGLTSAQHSSGFVSWEQAEEGRPGRQAGGQVVSLKPGPGVVNLECAGGPWVRGEVEACCRVGCTGETQRCVPLVYQGPGLWAENHGGLLCGERGSWVPRQMGMGIWRLWSWLEAGSAVLGVEGEAQGGIGGGGRVGEGLGPGHGG